MSYRKIVPGLALAMLVLAAGLAVAADDFTDTSERWEKSYNADDAAAIAALYTEDAVLMPPNAPRAAGKKAIQAFLEKDIAANKANALELESVSNGKNGDLGFARGTWRMKDAKGTVLDEGKWVEVRKKVNGKWMIDSDIWNSDRPLPE